MWLCAAANPTLVRGETGGSWGLASCPVIAGRAMGSTFTEELCLRRIKWKVIEREGHLVSSSSLHKCTCKHTNTHINDIPTTNIYALSMGQTKLCSDLDSQIPTPHPSEPVISRGMLFALVSCFISYCVLVVSNPTISSTSIAPHLQTGPLLPPHCRGLATLKQN